MKLLKLLLWMVLHSLVFMEPYPEVWTEEEGEGEGGGGREEEREAGCGSWSIQRKKLQPPSPRLLHL